MKGQRGPPRFTVSGHSSGGTMASAHFAAFSTLVDGLGHIEAAPFGCSEQMAPTELDDEVGPCHQGTNLSVARLISYTIDHFAKGKIDDPAGWTGRAVSVIAGDLDYLVRWIAKPLSTFTPLVVPSQVSPAVNKKAATLYRHFGANVSFRLLSYTGHVIPTDMTTWSTFMSPLWSGGYRGIAACNFDAAGHILQHLVGPLAYDRVAQRSASFLRVRERLNSC